MISCAPHFRGAWWTASSLLPLALLAACAGGPAAKTQSASAQPVATPAPASMYFKTVGASGADYATVQEAIDAVPPDNAEQKIIFIQPGKYFGHVQLNKPHVTLRGAGPDTVLSYNLGISSPSPDGRPMNWERSCTLLITGNDTALEDLTIENTYGKGMQALACGVTADRVTFRRCQLLGWQDTLRPENGRQLFDHCLIAGAVDFIYGGGTSYFQDCEIRSLGAGYLTAPSTRQDNIGFVFQDCRVTMPGQGYQAYLGRPWHFYSSTTFINTEMAAGVRPDGWKPWNVPASDTRFAEYQSYGPGANNAARASWATTSAGPAPAAFSRSAVLGDWDPGP